MIKIRNALLEALSYFMASVVVVLVCILPITIVLGCFKLIMMMFGG